MRGERAGDIHHGSSMSADAVPTLALSPIVAGAWRLAQWQWNAAERLRWIEQCVELGITSFDHADIYGAYTVEALFGEALAHAPALKAKLQMVSKCGIQLAVPARPTTRRKHYDTSKAHIIASAEQSLRNLGVDALDVLLIHRPDPLMDADEIAEAFTRLRQDGKVKAFGVSNFTPSQFALVDARTPLVTNQIEWHPLRPSPMFDGTLDQAQQLRRPPMIWSPLAGGALFTSEDEAARRTRGVLEAIGAQHSVSATTIAFAWLLRHPSKPVPVAGSRRVEVMADAMRALTVRLDNAEWTDIHVAATGREMP